MLVNYGGAVIGALAVLFVYSSNDEIYGYAHWLYSSATLLMPLASLGILSLVIKFYPAYSGSDSKNYNGFLSLISLLLAAAFLIFLFFWQYLSPRLYDLLWKEELNFELFQSYEKYILILCFLFIVLRFFTNQSANKLRIVVPNLIQQFGYKLFLPVIILVYAHYEWTIHRFSWGLIFFFIVAVLLMLVYLIQIDGFRFGTIRRPSSNFKYSDLFNFSLFGILNQIGNGMAMRIDSVMIPLLMGSTVFNSYYVKTFFIANLIELPTRSLNQIASPIISKAWKENNLDEIRTVYKKASNNLFLIGLYIFLGIWLCLDELVQISSDPSSFPYVKTLFLLLGAAKLIDMLTSVNSHIIGFSKLYRYNLAFILFLGILNLILNIKLIPVHGIVGAAIASAFSLFLYNLMKLLFIWKNFNLLPFSWNNLKSLSLASVIFLISLSIDLDFHPILNILIKGILLSIIYLPIAYLWNISQDVNDGLRAYLNKLK